MNADITAAIDLCNECGDACDRCASVCLNGDVVDTRIACITLNQECAQLCRLTASLLSRNSRYGREVGALAARAAEDCAGECEKHDDDDCLACADVCRMCAEALRSALRPGSRSSPENRVSH